MPLLSRSGTSRHLKAVAQSFPKKTNRRRTHTTLTRRTALGLDNNRDWRSRFPTSEPERIFPISLDLLRPCQGLTTNRGHESHVLRFATRTCDNESRACSNSACLFRCCEFSSAPRYFPANSLGGVDGLAIRVEDKQPGGKGSGIAVVRRVGGTDSMQFEQVTGSAEQMILTCSRPPTAASPCADDPRMLYRPVNVARVTPSLRQERFSFFFLQSSLLEKGA